MPDAGVVARRARGRPRAPRAAAGRGPRASPVAVGPRVRAREERRHRVGVREVELDAVEAGLARARGGVGEEAGQDLRQVADVGEVDVGDALAGAEVEVFDLARREQARARRRAGARGAPAAHGPPGPFAATGSPAQGGEPAAVLVADREEAPEELGGSRPPPDRQEVDALDQEARLAAARLADAPRPAAGGRERSGRGRSAGAARSATSRMPVASTTSTPGRPRAKRRYQSRTCGVTKPSSVARQGTIAGTQVRVRATTLRPSRMGENHRLRPASSAVGHRTAGS